jgi:CDP-4-dehydro-6-deoxyglucose reductase, E1
MIKLQKSTFFNEKDTKDKLCKFILQADILSMGDECKKFEAAFSKKQNRAFSTFVNSGSSANLILIQSLLSLGRIKKGDFVAVSALTWPTNIMPLIQLGLIPYLVDCEIDTLNISSKSLLVALEAEPKIKLLFLTNVLGFSDDIFTIQDICSSKNIILIEDNCESLGSVANGQLLGNFSLAATFSFFVGHHLSTIEGGMCCTDDEELSDQLIMCRSHGWDRSLKNEAQSRLRNKNEVTDFYSKYTFYDLGYNLRPNEINGFIGNIQLAFWDKIVEARYNNFKLLNQVMANNKELLEIRHDHMDIVSAFATPVIAKNSSITKYLNAFQNSNVECRPMIAGNMMEQPFYKKYVSLKQKLPNVEFIQNNSFYVVNNPELTAKEKDVLINCLEL